MDKKISIDMVDISVLTNFMTISLTHIHTHLSMYINSDTDIHAHALGAYV